MISQIVTTISLIATTLLTISPQMLAQSNITGGEWIQDENITNWNQPGAKIPTVRNNDLIVDNERCSQTIRQTTTKEDQMLVAAGWTLFGSIQVYGKTSVISAMIGTDGMCRPLAYQKFVFVNGKFAGTLSPNLMNSRRDGAINNVYLTQESELSAEISRYQESDALCCPFQTSYVNYKIETKNGQPVVIPITSITNDN